MQGNYYKITNVDQGKYYKLTWATLSPNPHEFPPTTIRPNSVASSQNLAQACFHYNRASRCSFCLPRRI